LIDLAYAMGNLGAGTTGAGGGDFSFIIMMSVIFVIFYFLLIRPQQKKQKELKQMLDNLNHGDTVITSGGILGKIMALTETEVTLEIAEKTRIKVSRSYIIGIKQKATKD
jgi:preprotein translocase subunit YajC